MTLADLAGATFGPFGARVGAERVGAYVAATGDDPQRWAAHAPPGYAGALLFVAAPAFLDAERVRPFTKLLVHADQTFTWRRALEVGEEVTVEGSPARVRERAGNAIVTFDAVVRAAGDEVIASRSTFLMGEAAPETPPIERPEPPVAASAANEPLPEGIALRQGPLPAMARSASRLDLVKYAAASGDFNPVHFDHASAVAAGFEGVLVHGLLMGAWLLQLAAAASDRPDAVAFAKLRFRNPLHPAVAAVAAGDVADLGDDRASLRMSLTGAGTTYVDGRVDLRTG